MSTLKHSVFENLEKHKLKLNPKKCEFFKGKVVYLGHIVSAEGIHMDPTKKKAVVNWPIPKCTKRISGNSLDSVAIIYLLKGMPHLPGH